MSIGTFKNQSSEKYIEKLYEYQSTHSKLELGKINLKTIGIWIDIFSIKPLKPTLERLKGAHDIEKLLLKTQVEQVLAQ